MQPTQPPEDKFSVVYYSMMLLGVGYLLPYNILITCIDYLAASFPDYRNTIEYSMIPVNIIPNQILMLLLIKFGHKLSFSRRIVTSFFALTCFIVAIPLCNENISDSRLDYIIFLTFVAVFGALGAVISTALFGFAALFPSQYSQAIQIGQALAGLLICVLRIITKLVSPDDLDLSATLYFSIGGFVLFCCGLSFLYITGSANWLRCICNLSNKLCVLITCNSVNNNISDTKCCCIRKKSLKSSSNNNNFKFFRKSSRDNKNFRHALLEQEDSTDSNQSDPAQMQSLQPKHAKNPEYGSAGSSGSSDSSGASSSSAQAFVSYYLRLYYTSKGLDSKKRLQSLEKSFKKASLQPEVEELERAGSEQVVNMVHVEEWNGALAGGMESQASKDSDSLDKSAGNLEVLEAAKEPKRSVSSAEASMMSERWQVPTMSGQVRYFDIFAKIRSLAFTNFCVMFVTFLVFPGMTSQIQSQIGKLNDDDWFALLLITEFNIGDLIGRWVFATHKVLHCKFDKSNLWLAALTRVLLYPLFIAMYRGQIQSDLVAYVAIGYFSVSNGMYTTLAFMNAPGLVYKHEQEIAGAMMTFSLCFGITCGSLVSLGMTQVL